MKFEIKSRWTGEVIFTDDIDCDDGASHSINLGFAVKVAVNANANLAGADLARANLAHADLVDANLARADLAGANLARANLAGANLARANLAGAKLARAVGIVGAGHDPRGYEFFAVKQDDGWKVKAGCRWFTFPEAEAHWKNNLDASARVNLLRTLVSLRD